MQIHRAREEKCHAKLVIVFKSSQNSAVRKDISNVPVGERGSMELAEISGAGEEKSVVRGQRRLVALAYDGLVPLPEGELFILGPVRGRLVERVRGGSSRSVFPCLPEGE